jgi:hypothetical protein
MEILKSINYLILFFVEVAMLYNFAVWGSTLKASIAVRFLAGLGAPCAVIALWAMFFSPDPALNLPQPWNAIGEYTLFSLSALAVASAGRTKWASVFLLAAIASETIALMWK